MKRIYLLLMPCLLLASIAVGLLLYSKGTAQAASTRNCGSWQVVPSPNQGGRINQLNAVAAISPNDVWTVGTYNLPNHVVNSLFEHWNGSRWELVSGPQPSSTRNYLTGVAAIPGTNHAWAVGFYYTGSQPLTLIDYWDGSKWSVVSSPNVGSSSYSTLSAVTAISATDAWAVGTYSSSNHTANRTLIEHWDGSKWSIVSSPSIGSLANFLTGVAAVSANDVWAVGLYNSARRTPTLIEHWNGSKWTVIPHVSSGLFSELASVTAVPGSQEVWAVGFTSSTLIDHWNGTEWTIVSHPSPGVTSGLEGVTAISANNVWAVGYYLVNGNPNRLALIEHWDGTRWRVVTSPANLPPDSFFASTNAVPGTTQVWATGDGSNGNGKDRTLTANYC